MKKILVTQRVDSYKNRNERRDALDQRWINFLLACNLLPITISNNNEHLDYILNTFEFDGILFTGGNNLAIFDQDAPERDNVEQFLIEYAIRESKPILGVCRGMQFIQNHFGSVLQKVSNHVATEHLIQTSFGSRTTNSYHNFACLKVEQPLQAWAKSTDGIIEAINHVNLPIAGIMWHPERNIIFDTKDIQFFKDFYNECIDFSSR